MIKVLHVLVVDDDPIYLQFMRTMLAQDPALLKVRATIVHGSGAAGCDKINVKQLY